MQPHRTGPPALRPPHQQRCRLAQVVEIPPFDFENLGDPQTGAPHDERRGARLVPVMGRQRVQQTLHLVGRPVMRYFHGGRIHLDELCQKEATSAVAPRTTTTAGTPKVAELGANSAIPVQTGPLSAEAVDVLRPASSLTW